MKYAGISSITVHECFDHDKEGTRGRMKTGGKNEFVRNRCYRENDRENEMDRNKSNQGA